jgi:acetyl esterase/lipase
MSDTQTLVVLEPAAAIFARDTDEPPYLYDLAPAEGRRLVDEVQGGEISKPQVDIVDAEFGGVSVRILRPPNATGRLPVVLYTHGAGWVFGNAHTHDRLVRELAVGSGSAVVFVNYDLSPEARYPVALEQVYSVAASLATHAEEHQLDASRLVVAGDSVGGNMTAALTLLEKERGGMQIGGQVLFYPVTDAGMDSGSYDLFAEGYFLRREGMAWFWDQYLPDESRRFAATVSPLRASTDELSGLPPALVITAEADVLRDEGEAYAARLREAGVAVTATRYLGAIHDFVMLNALRGTQAAEAAIAQAVDYIRRAHRVTGI